MAFQFFADYLTHRLTAKTRHGTHSPFVYKLIDEVIYNFSAKKPYHDIEQQRKKLCNDDTAVSSNDSNTQDKKVKQLAKTYRITVKVDQLYYRLVGSRSAHHILQIGNQFGITTAYLAKANPQANFTGITPSKALANLTQANLTALNITNVSLQVGDPAELLTNLSTQNQVFDIVSIHGKYSKLNILQYFNLCLNNMNETSWFMLGDIYQDEDRKAAWAEIKTHPRVTVTIDLFWLGIVCFKTDQAKENFKVKFPVPTNQKQWGIKDRWIKP